MVPVGLVFFVSSSASIIRAVNAALSMLIDPVSGGSSLSAAVAVVVVVFSAVEVVRWESTVSSN